MTEAGGRIAETEVREAVPQEDSAGRFSGNRELLLRARAGDKAALEQLVIDNAGLVRSIAVRFRDRGTDMEDLMQIGTIGMIKAIRSFDTARGTAFSTYAVPLIVGEIRRHFRDDGLIRVSRSCRHLGVCLMRERSRILSEEGREAGIAELAAACGASVEDAALNLGANSFRSFKDVIIPLLKAPFMSSFVLSFLRSVTCLSVVIFLYAPSTTVGTISVMVLVQSGQYGEAAAFTIVLITIAFTVLKLAQWVLGKQGIELEL